MDSTYIAETSQLGDADVFFEIIGVNVIYSRLNNGCIAVWNIVFRLHIVNDIVKL